MSLAKPTTVPPAALAADLPPIVLIDESRAGLAPLTDLRAVFDVRTGAATLAERLTLQGVPPAAMLVPDHLADLTRERHPSTPINTLDHLAGDVLIVSGAAGPVTLDHLQTAARSAGRDVFDAHGSLVARRADVRELRATPAGARLALAHANSAERPLPTRLVMSRPWHVRSMRDACVAMDLALIAQRIRSGPPRTVPLENVTVIGQRPLTIAASAKIAPGCILDVEAGPIVIDERASVRPGAIIIGPVYLGPDSAALERATIRPNTAIGPFCKVNGEVGGTIFQGFANKAHDGYLGDSYVGEWVNLGAGTTGSNLLNTYAEIVAKAPDDAGTITNQRTGETFFGCVLGDHVKAAICTRIMTGSIIGTGAMFAASYPLSGCTPAMTWITDDPSGKPSPRPYRFEKFLEVAIAVMARRNVSPSPAYISALRRLAHTS